MKREERERWVKFGFKPVKGGSWGGVKDMRKRKSRIDGGTLAKDQPRAKGR